MSLNSVCRSAIRSVTDQQFRLRTRCAHRVEDSCDFVLTLLLQIAIEQGVDFELCLTLLRQAREKGLTVPVVLMGAWSGAGLPPKVSSAKRSRH